MKPLVEKFLRQIKDAIEWNIQDYDGYSNDCESDDRVIYGIELFDEYHAEVEVIIHSKIWHENGDYLTPSTQKGIIHWSTQNYTIYCDGEITEKGEVKISGKYSW